MIEQIRAEVGRGLRKQKAAVRVAGSGMSG
jgi:hypothetical protein